MTYLEETALKSCPHKPININYPSVMCGLGPCDRCALIDEYKLYNLGGIYRFVILANRKEKIHENH
jgi:hypothetical protein